jgi:hypothetical protein
MEGTLKSGTTETTWTGYQYIPHGKVHGSMKKYE